MISCKTLASFSVRHTLVAAISVRLFSQSTIVYAQFDAGGPFGSLYVNDISNTVYSTPGDVLKAFKYVLFHNNTGVQQTIWVTVELLDSADNVIASDGESIDVNDGDTEIAFGNPQGMPTTCYGDTIKVRVTWGTSDLGQVGSVISGEFTCEN